jgi:hypothetical protein
MHQRNHMLAIGLLASVLVTFSAQQQAKAHEEVMLTEQDILAQIIGNTAISVGEEHGWSEYYQPDGIIRGRSVHADGQEHPMQGKWTVSGSEMCFDYAGSGDAGCWTISVEGNEVTYHKKGKDDVMATLLKGNPENF